MQRKPKKQVPLKEKALDLLSRRRLSRGELRDKLVFRGYPVDEIEKLLDHYEDLGFLNDKSLALDYAVQRLKSIPMGRLRLKAELFRRRLPENLIQQAVEAAFNEISEEDSAQTAFTTLTRTLKDRRKIWNKMMRLGFPHDIIESVLADFRPEEE